jgi:hypothetical protein
MAMGSPPSPLGGYGAGGLVFTSWNRLIGWVQQIDRFRIAA